MEKQPITLFVIYKTNFRTQINISNPPITASIPNRFQQMRNQLPLDQGAISIVLPFLLPLSHIFKFLHGGIPRTSRLNYGLMEGPRAGMTGAVSKYEYGRWGCRVMIGLMILICSRFRVAESKIVCYA